MSRVKVSVTGNNAQFQRVIADTGKRLQTLGNRLRGINRASQTAFRGMGRAAEAASRSMASAGRAGGIAIRSMSLAGVAAGVAFGAAAGKAVKAASDLGETVSKTQAIFGKGDGNKLVQWGGQVAGTMGLSKQAALDAAGTFATFGKGAGLTGDALSGFSTELTGLSADLASFYNTSPEDAITAIGAALRGEAEPIRRYGVLMNDASLKAMALKAGIISTTKDALSPQQKVLAAHLLLLDQTRDAQGDFARTSGGLANQSRILQARLANISAELGTAFLPGVLKAASAANQMMTAFTASGGVDSLAAKLKSAGDLFMQSFRNPAGAIDVFAASLQAAVLGVGNVLIAVFKTGATFFKDGLLESLAGIGQVLTGIMLKAFTPAVAYLQASIEKAFAIGSNIIARREQVKKEVAAGNMQNELGIRLMVKPLDSQQIAMIRKQLETITDPGKRARKEAAIRVSTAGADSESIADRAARIQSEGVRFGTGQGQTADEMIDEGKGNARRGLEGASRAASAFRVPDVLGAGKALTEARESMGRAATGINAANAGAPAPMALASAGSGATAAPTATANDNSGSGEWEFRQPVGPKTKEASGPPIRRQVFGLNPQQAETIHMAQRRAYGTGPSIGERGRRLIPDSLAGFAARSRDTLKGPRGLVSGPVQGAEGGVSGGAHGLIRRGDAKKKKEADLAKAAAERKDKANRESKDPALSIQQQQLEIMREAWAK